jgi:O-antigen/teichoic acid export membrane protein
VWLIPAGPFVAGVLAAVELRRTGAWRTRPVWDAAASRRLLLDALPFAVLAGIAAFTLRFDLVFVSIVDSAAETARYDLALRSVEALTYLGGAIAAPAIFILTRRLARGDHDGAQRALAEAARFSYLAGIPLSVLLALLADPAVALLYGREFADVGTPLAVLALQLWLVLLVSLLGSTVIAAGLGRAVIPISGGVALVGVGLDVLLVPPYGATGAAFAAVGAQAAALIGFVWFTYHRAGLSLTRPAPSVLLAAAAAGGVTALTEPALGLAAAVPGAAAYLAALLALGGLDRRDLVLLRASARAEREELVTDA